MRRRHEEECEEECEEGVRRSVREGLMADGLSGDESKALHSTTTERNRWGASPGGAQGGVQAGIDHEEPKERRVAGFPQ